MRLARPGSVMLLAVAVAALAIFSGQPAAQQPSFPNAPAGPIALVGGMLIDGTGAAPVANGVILIDNGRIQRVGTVETLPVPGGYTSISTEGMTMLPGLWDMHVHLLYSGHTNIQYWHRTYTDRFATDTMPAAALQLVQAGVTTARDLGAPPESVFAVKRQIAEGNLPGPAILAAGPQLTHEPPDWARFYRRGMTGADEARARAREFLEAGADVLKITDAEAMEVEEIRAITAEAHARGRRVAAHGRTDAEILKGLEGGVDEFEHIGVTPNDTGYPAEVLAAIRARVASGPPLYWTPTVGLPLNGEYLQRNREVLDHPANYAGLPQVIAADVRKALEMFRPQAAPVEAIRRKVNQLREAGVILLIGTDAGLAGNFHRRAIAQELSAWVNVLGVSPLEAIHTATGRAADAIGFDTGSGTIAAGRAADVVVVDGDPLRNIEVMASPAMVFARGRRVQ